MIPLLINKDKLKTIKDQIQNKFAELDFRDEGDTLDHVLAALQQITEELAEIKYKLSKDCENSKIDSFMEAILELSL